MAPLAYSLIQHQANLSKIAELQASVRPLAENLLRLSADRGIPLKVVQAFRSPGEQQALYESGRGVTNAPALSSYHNYRLAFDVVPLAYLSLPDWNPSGSLWADVGALGKSVGLEWGGDWTKKDLPHFQLTGAPISELKAYFQKFGEVMPITISATAGGTMIALVVMALALWLYRDQL